jgi:3-oxoacyl-[acyl-carrier protein] reductase
MKRLSGKNAIITGSTRGIGKGIALRFAEEGANVCITGTKIETVEPVVKEIEALGVRALGFALNVADYKAVEEMTAKVKEAWGSLDILVNNAGITKDNLILRMTPEDFDAVININLKGVFNGMKAAVPIMMKQRSGKIINISSVIGLTGNAGQANYAASKAGIIGMTKSIAKEFAARGMQVNAIAPGYIQTDMTDKVPDNIKEEILKMVPMKRMGQPEDIAKAALFLASGDSDYITGQTLVVDGGMVMS